ncbi:polyphosphate kinase 2 [Hugenholtzia roseola]|uniref:polyphosphate kinase 2 n=1 Tax=Hugenholtzia roseola TaxID=1002 RepID=UPI0004787292|nr:polyphosphate kinase 2 [Hugenholtzia roseola]
MQFSEEDLALLATPKGVKALLKAKKINLKSIVKTLHYEQSLELLQIELVKMQQWIIKNNIRLAIIFEGRDAAGKGGAILRFTQHLMPRQTRIVALPKPTELERGQWYFQRYIPHLPNPSEMVFFDRSWYNRAVVEPAMGFCTPKAYERFMEQVSEFEHLITEDGIILIKFWFNLSKKEQAKRFEQRAKNPLKQWKLSPVDKQAQEKWDIFTHYREKMLDKTHFKFAPWVVIDADDKEDARLAAIHYVLSQFDYEDKKLEKIDLDLKKDLVSIYHQDLKMHD